MIQRIMIADYNQLLNTPIENKDLSSFSPKDASGYVRGSWLQSSVQSNYGRGTGMVCVFDGSGWIYYRTPSEILTEAGGAKASDIPTFELSGDTLIINF